MYVYSVRGVMPSLNFFRMFMDKVHDELLAKHNVSFSPLGKEDTRFYGVK